MKILLTLFCLISWVSVRAQYSAAIDSLNNLLATDLSLNDKAYTLDELSYQWFSQNLDSSLYYGREAHRLFKKTNDPKGLSQSATDVAVAYHYLSQWDSAKFYYEKALAIRKANNDTAKVASSLNNLGVMYMDKEEYDKATNYYVEAMKVRSASKDSVGVAITKFNLGLIFKKQGNFEKAIAYYEQAKEDFKSFGKENNLEVILLNLGSIYNTIGDFEKGAAYNRELLQLASKRSSKRNLAKSYVNLANSYQGLGYPDSSLYYGKKGLEFFEDNKDSLNIAHSLLSISQFYLDKKAYKNCINYAQRLEKLNDVLQNRELLIDNKLILAQAYASINDYKKAFQKMDQAFSQKDSLLSESLNKTITDLTLKYDTEQKEREISQLKVINQQAIIDQQQSANQRNILIFVSSVFIIGAGLLFLLLRTKSKSNTIISKSLQEKEVLLKEIHHRVKNNLQIISSILSLQSRFIEDENTKAVVNESQNRVKSMALIHQRLYQHDSSTGVEALDYIQSLASILSATYGIENDQVKITYDIDPMVIDVDTIIPVGLILNELISNSFKYAFPNKRPGVLEISFKEKNNQLLLTVKDDGVGAEKDIENIESFGIRMIRSLSRKLEAQINFDFTKGTTAALVISKYKLV